MKTERLGVAILLLAIVAGVAHAESQTGRLPSCDRAAVDALDPEGLSLNEASVVCETMASALGHFPDKTFAKQMFKMLFGFEYLGYTEKPQKIAASVMSAIRYRGQLEKPDKIKFETMNVIFKTYQGSGRTVLPADFAAALREMDPRQAAALSDHGMYTLGAIIQMEKN